MVLSGKLALSVACLALALVAFSWPRLGEMSQRAFNRCAICVLAASRLALFAAVFLIARMPAASDVLVYYGAAKNTMAGRLPYRDFPSLYGFLFPYIASIPLRIWDSPKSIILFAIAIEVLCLRVWMTIGRRCFPEQVVRNATILYVFSPLPLVNVAIDGQQQVWIALLVGLSMLAALNRRETTSAAIIALSAPITKVFALLFVPALWIAGRRRSRYALAVGVGLLVIAGVQMLYGLDVFQPARLASDSIASGNLPFLFTALGFDAAPAFVRRLADALAISAIVSVFAAAVINGGLLADSSRQHAGRATTYLIALSLLAFLIVTKRAFANYLVMAFFAICLSACSGSVSVRDVLRFGIFGAVATLEPSLWFRWMNEDGLGALARSASLASVSMRVPVFIAVEVSLLVFYGRYLIQAYAGATCQMPGEKESELERTRRGVLPAGMQRAAGL